MVPLLQGGAVLLDGGGVLGFDEEGVPGGEELGSNGTILRYNGTSWTAMVSGTTQDLFGVWGSGPNDVFAVGEEGTILRYDRYDGTSWTAMASGTTAHLYGVWGSGPNDVFAVGRARILHFDGRGWSPQLWPPEVPLTTDLHGVWFSTSRGFAVGSGGTTLLLLRGPCTATEGSCTNDRDDDCDGRYDCSDPDCTADATCAAGGLCQGSAALSCATTISGTTVGGPRRIDSYFCTDWFEHGREAYYHLDAPATGTVTVRLTPVGHDLDLYVLGRGAAGGCEPRNPHCLGGSSTGGSAEEMVSFTAQAGERYYVVVDGFGSNMGNFQLQVTCP